MESVTDCGDNFMRVRSLGSFVNGVEIGFGLQARCIVSVPMSSLCTDVCELLGDGSLPFCFRSGIRDH